MKNDDQIVLLEAISEEVEQLRKLVASHNAAEKITSLQAEVERLTKGIEQILSNGLDHASNAQDEQRLIDLRHQLDRISLRAEREDNLLRYYLASPKVILTTVMIIALSVLAGLLLEKYQVLKKHQSIEYPTQP